MEANANAIFGAVRQGHMAAAEKAQAEMPKLEVNELISLVASVLGEKGNRAEAAMTAAKKLAAKYQKPVEVYLNAFAVFALENGLKQVKFRDVSKLGTEEFAEKVIEAVKKVESAVAAYCRADIDEVALISRLGEAGVLDVAQSFLQACGVDVAKVKGQVQAVLEDFTSVGILLVSFYASAAAYKLLREALQDAAVAHENRIQVEEECAKSIERMRSYRERMNAAVSDYLFVRAETFNAGVAAMDQAILEGDVNGFLRGNVAIQEMLNYKIQFHNQEEFDALMDSDEAFVL